MNVKWTRYQLFQIVLSSEYKLYLRILETGLTGSYLGILGLNWANIGPKLAQNVQKYTIRSTGSARTFFALHLKRRALFFHVKHHAIGIEAQMWSISNPKWTQNWSKIGPKWSNGYRTDRNPLFQTV